MVPMGKMSFGVMLIVLSLSGTGAAAELQDEGALADPLEQGIVAYQRGDFASACG